MRSAGACAACLRGDSRRTTGEYSALFKPRPISSTRPARTAIGCCSASLGRPAMIEDLLARAPIRTLPNNKGWTALHQAAYAHPPSDSGVGWRTSRLYRLKATRGLAPQAFSHCERGVPEPEGSWPSRTKPSKLAQGKPTRSTPLSRPIGPVLNLSMICDIARCAHKQEVDVDPDHLKASRIGDGQGLCRVGHIDQGRRDQPTSCETAHSLLVGAFTSLMPRHKIIDEVLEAPCSRCLRRPLEFSGNVRRQIRSSFSCIKVYNSGALMSSCRTREGSRYGARSAYISKHQKASA